MSYDEHLISQAGGDGDELDQIQARRGPEGVHNPSPRELAAAIAIRAMEAQDHESDPDYPALTEYGALRLAAAAIAAAQLVDIENGIDRIRRSEILAAQDDAWKSGYEACYAGKQKHSPYRPAITAMGVSK